MNSNYIIISCFLLPDLLSESTMQERAKNTNSSMFAGIRSLLARENFNLLEKVGCRPKTNV